MIWVIGGTKDSRDFLEKFVKYNDDIIVSTATEYGAKLIENLPVKTSSEKMDKEAMLKFVEDNKITKVVDTSHPYAFEVSKNAMEVAEEKNIEYFRFHFAVDDHVEAANHFFDRNHYTFDAGKLLCHSKGLRQEALNATCTVYGKAVFI